MFLIVSNHHELQRCFPVMQELRPHLDFATFLSIYNEAHRDSSYTLVALIENDSVVALMGYRILTDFVRGRHVYIDDLVSTGIKRSKGFGKQLLEYAEEIAKESECATLRLCTGIENERGIKFYETNGWIKRAFAYTKKI